MLDKNAEKLHKPTRVEIEIRRRIKISVWAYAYEFEDDSIVDDHTFDAECLKIDMNMKTGNKKLDDFFYSKFTAYTGMWIYKHPELDKIKKIYQKYFEL